MCKYYENKVEVDKIWHCPNTQIGSDSKKRLLLGKSEICDGLGIFAGQKIKKHDLIGEYVGEVISIEEFERRYVIQEKMNIFYCFDIKNRIV